MLKLPKTIKIGPHRYSVTNNPSSDVNGRCDLQRMRIEVDDSLPTQLLAEVLLHECLHAIIMNLGLRNISAVSENEELIVSSMAPALLSLMADNPALFDAIRKAVK